MPRVSKIIAWLLRFSLAFCFFCVQNVTLDLIAASFIGRQSLPIMRTVGLFIDLLLIVLAAIWSRQKALKEREENDRLIREYIEENLS